MRDPNTIGARDARLRLRDLAVAADGRRLLEGIDLALAAGELVALRGPSGCGKTTLLRAVAGLDDPAGGEVTLDGESPCDLCWPAYRRRVVLVEQRPTLLAGPVCENLSRPFTYGTATGLFDEDAAFDRLARLGLTRVRCEQEARDLSVGEQQRVCLVRALLIAPEILLLDEPTSALDEESAASVEKMVREEADRRGMAALIVTHDQTQADRWCDRRFDLDSCRAADAEGEA